MSLKNILGRDARLLASLAARTPEQAAQQEVGARIFCTNYLAKQLPIEERAYNLIRDNTYKGV